ncbi:alpha amylase catalytic subunit [Paenibacillus taihuensis]|uniref:Alpha amylase catalytic subunit n=1 Tax=Paenibacillus taihuensis TaxID=1156355 RepID=A0A3D9S7Q8_9BACL|nr:alpha-amylase family protein [Paenibacillus taihuensis]REE86178.1 alpha amylase catalytic subunit [Paenibacillus taihuensis]
MGDSIGLPLKHWACGDVVYTFGEEDGRLHAVQVRGRGVWHGDLSLDIGADGTYGTGRLAWHSFEGANTWELPRIVPADGEGAESAESRWQFVGWDEQDAEGNSRESVGGAASLVARYRNAGLSLSVCYSTFGANAAIDAVFENTGTEIVYVNGVAFMASQRLGSEGTEFDFPGNVPYKVFDASALDDRSPVETGLVNPVIKLKSSVERTNLIFVDEEEKWGTGVYRDGETLHLVNLAAVEANLAPGEKLACGTLYIQPVGSGDPFELIRELYIGKGWVPPTDGHREGVLYSCHPHGTMDSDFPIKRDMAAFADELPALRDMGIDHVWVLPIFEHLERGVYHPTDQRIVDERYGDDRAVETFSRKLHELGMTLLFDYVPHGPELEDPLGIEFRRWASLRRDGNPQIEWNCLSFDMTNPEYLEYTKELVKEHVRRFDVDGARIDCAMGGLTNWRPYGTNRPSNSNLKGGIEISKAIRDGFLEAGKKPLSTPENFNPVPAYAPYTDVFYDMALYRVFFEMEAEGLVPADFARELTRWLEAEMLSTVPGYVKLRFLGNHDTVTWVWNKSRATAWYGEERAKALWVLLSCIDGIPMLYQGDEDASIYLKEGPVLRDFFRELFQMRRQYLNNDFTTEYEYTGTPVVAFWRKNGADARFIAVNLSNEPVTFAVPASLIEAAIVYGAAETNVVADESGGSATIGAYGSAVWSI